MQFPKIRMLVALAFLFFSCGVWAQEKIEREAVIHDNVKLIALAPAQDIPEEIQKQYHAFLPTFEQVLKESTTAESEACSLTLRVVSGFKEVGAAKTQRPLVRVTAFRRNAKQEYVATFLLYNYVTAGPVNKEDTTQFLKKQILEPAECGGKTE